MRKQGEEQSEKGTPKSTQPVPGLEPRVWDSTASAPYTCLGCPSVFSYTTRHHGDARRVMMRSHNFFPIYPLHRLKSCLQFSVKSLRTADVTDAKTNVNVQGLLSSFASFVGGHARHWSLIFTLGLIGSICLERYDFQVPALTSENVKPEELLERKSLTAVLPLCNVSLLCLGFPISETRDLD